MSRHQHCTGNRNGLTLIEIIVLLAIVVVLAALFLPYVRSARGPARKVQCLSNMRNVGLAMQNYASANQDALPPLTMTKTVTNSAQLQGQEIVGWPIMLLPALDNAALLRRIGNNSTVNNGVAAMAATEKVRVNVFECPDSLNPNNPAATLSFVGNVGFVSSELWGINETPTLFHQPYLINWKGVTSPPYRSTDGVGTLEELSATDRNVALATGVFWRIVGSQSPPTYSPSLEYIRQGDGTGTTLMLTENLNAGLWFDTDVNSIGFGIRIPVASSNFAPNVGTEPPYGPFEAPGSLNADFPHSTFTTSNSASWINQPAGGTLAPRPSSMHQGGVNVIMADGSGRCLSHFIDPLVYTRLITSNGVAFGEKELKPSAY